MTGAGHDLSPAVAMQKTIGGRKRYLAAQSLAMRLMNRANLHDSARIATPDKRLQKRRFFLGRHVRGVPAAWLAKGKNLLPARQITGVYIVNRTQGITRDRRDLRGRIAMAGAKI